jgi:hypothetical protein
MKRIYSAQFNLGNGDPAPVEDVVKEIRSWVEDNKRRPPHRCSPKIDHPFFGTGRSGSGENTVETVRWADSGPSGWACRWNQPEGDSDHPAMYTEIILREINAALTCSIHVGYTRAVPVEKELRPLRPRLTPLLIEKFGARHGLQLSTMAVSVAAKDMPKLIGELSSRERKLPSVVFSISARTGKPSCDTKVVAEILSGVAHVYVLADNATSDEMIKQAGRSHACYNGAAKLFWPGWTPADDPFLHRLFPFAELEPVPETHTHRAANRLLKVVAGASSAMPHPWPAEFVLAKLKLDGLERLEEIQMYKDEIAKRDETIQALVSDREGLRSRVASARVTTPTKSLRVAVYMGPDEKAPRRPGWERRFEELNQSGANIEWEFFSEKYPPLTGFDYWILDSKTFSKHKDSDFSFQQNAAKAKVRALSLNSTSDLVYRPAALDRALVGK